jgi:hypothetical protein
MVRGITRSAIFYDGADRERFSDPAGMVFAEERTACYALNNREGTGVRSAVTMG